MKKWDIKFYIAVLVFLSFLHLVFALRTNAFFSIDDFFVIQYFRDRDVWGIIPEFILKGDINEFRRLIGFLVFGGLLKTFGVNNIPFDIFLFLTNTANLTLLFFVVKKLTKNNFAAFFVSIIFNKNYLFYYSNLHEHLLATFCILTIFFFLYYPKKFYLSLISFILAVFTKETAVTVPLVLYSISFFYKLDRKKIMYLLIISIAFGIYASYYFVVKKIVGQNEIYMPSFQLLDILKGYLYYVDYKIILLGVGLALYYKKYKYLPLLAIVFITLTPASLLVHRREIYYLYMPFLYLMIYFSLFLPKLNIKSSILYILIFFIFGGRSILPQIAWQEFPNWQKESINKVLDKVESGSDDFSDIKLERDARLMIDSNTTDLFMKERSRIKERNMR